MKEGDEACSLFLSLPENVRFQHLFRLIIAISLHRSLLFRLDVKKLFSSIAARLFEQNSSPCRHDAAGRQGEFRKTSSSASARFMKQTSHCRELSARSCVCGEVGKFQE